MADQNEQSLKAASALFALLDENGKPVVLDDEGQILAEPEDTSDLITLKEWAKRNGISPATARQKAGRGALKTARKIGRDWMISASEKNPDHRLRIGAVQNMEIEGPVGIREVLNYLRILNASLLPDRWYENREHQEYCRSIFFGLRNRLSGNTLVLFDMICEAMEEQLKTEVYYIPHDKMMSEFEDEAWVTSNRGISSDSGVTVDFSDYLKVLENTASDLLSQNIKLSIHHGQQTMILPWYHSLSWKRSSDDGIYFVPSDFFKVIFEGIH